MSLIIFFGFSLFIFLSGVLVLSITFYYWFKQFKYAKKQNSEAIISQENL